MSETVPTIMVKRKDDNFVCLINLSDFNPELHDAVGAETETSFDREAAKKALDERGIKYAKNVSNEKLQELLDLSANPKTMGIVEIEGKFIIVNAAGEQQGEEAFEKKEDAELMLEMLTGGK